MESASHAQNPSGSSPQSWVVLHVDDDTAFCEALKLRLTQGKYKVLTAHSGKEALDILEKALVHIAILDVSMPQMNGYQLAKIIRSKYPHTPIVMLTGYRDDRNMSMSLNANCQSLIEKPFPFEVLEFNIQRLLGSPNIGNGFKPSSEKK